MSTKKILEVALYLSDLSEDKILEGGLLAGLPPSLIQHTDKTCGLNGALVKYMTQIWRIKPEWIPEMSVDQLRNFLREKYTDRVFQACRVKAQQTPILYTLCVIMDC